MNKVADIIARKGVSAIAVPPDTTVVEALRIMAEKNIGSVLVMDGGEYVGIMTERDYSRKVALKGKKSNETRVAEIMSTELPSIKPGDSVEHCMQLMTEKNIRYLPVFDKEMIAGTCRPLPHALRDADRAARTHRRCNERRRSRRPCRSAGRPTHRRQDR